MKVLSLSESKTGKIKVSNTTSSNKTKAVFFTLLAGCLWGTSFPIIKIGLNTIDPFAFVFWRFLVSTVTLFVIMLLLGKVKFEFPKKITKCAFIAWHNGDKTKVAIMEKLKDTNCELFVHNFKDQKLLQTEVLKCQKEHQ